MYEVVPEPKRITRTADEIYFRFTIFIVCLICIAIAACVLCRYYYNKNGNYAALTQKGQPLYVQQGEYNAPNLQNVAPENQPMTY